MRFMTVRLARVAGHLLWLLALAAGRAACAPPDPGRAETLRRPAGDSLTVVVTDSGLGGLSVVADAARKLTELRAFRHVDIVFSNALFSDQGGYNSLPDRADKIRVFDRALQGIERRDAPDLILVACNTLSVLVDDTEFVTAGHPSVIGIVDAGVRLIAERLAADSTSRVILFATETTVAEGTHRAALVARGIRPDRMILQPCPELASYIEKGFDSPETRLLVDAYVEDALGRAGNIDGPIYVSLNCTHYGYAMAAWREAFAARGVPVAGFLNPNLTMIDGLWSDPARARVDSVEVRVRVVSMVEIPQETIDSLGGLLQQQSPTTATALREYQLIPDLFLWRDVVKGGVGR